MPDEFSRMHFQLRIGLVRTPRAFLRASLKASPDRFLGVVRPYPSVTSSLHLHQFTANRGCVGNPQCLHMKSGSRVCSGIAYGAAHAF